jgi:hypothetical protein
MMLRFDDAEFAAVLDAAQRSGLTPSGYAAEVAIAVATESRPPEGDPFREALVELMQARTQVRRFAVHPSSEPSSPHDAVAASRRPGPRTHRDCQ